MAVTSQSQLELGIDGVQITLDLASGGRAISWLVDGDELLGRRSSDPVEYGMYAMGPWAGRIAANEIRFGNASYGLPATYALPATYGPWALHGTTLSADATLLDEQRSADFARATTKCSLGPTWPWIGCLTATWEVRADSVTTTLEISTAEDAFPAVLGWHPWFNRVIEGSGPARWHANRPLLAERTEDFHLTGALVEVPGLAEGPGEESGRAGPFDDAFLIDDRVVSIDWPGRLRVDVTSSHDWFVIFDALPEFLCIEPQSGPPNGINDGLVAPVAMVLPGQPITMVTTWQLTRARPPG